MGKRKKKEPTLTNQLLEAIEDSGQSVRSIALGAGIPQPSLHRFIKGERDIRLDTAAKIADYLGMRLTKSRVKPKG